MGGGSHLAAAGLVGCRVIARYFRAFDCHLSPGVSSGRPLLPSAPEIGRSWTALEHRVMGAHRMFHLGLQQYLSRGSNAYGS